jgi:hypothetical protein
MGKYWFHFQKFQKFNTLYHFIPKKHDNSKKIRLSRVAAGAQWIDFIHSVGLDLYLAKYESDLLQTFYKN